MGEGFLPLGVVWLGEGGVRVDHLEVVDGRVDWVWLEDEVGDFGY